jgi:hypothetical protein
MLAEKDWEDRAWKWLQFSSVLVSASAATYALRHFLGGCTDSDVRRH